MTMSHSSGFQRMGHVIQPCRHPRGVGVWSRTGKEDEIMVTRIVGDTVSMEGDTVPT